MLKLYYFLQSKIQAIELKLSGVIQKRIDEPYSSSIFYFNAVFLNLLLVFWQIVIDFLKFVIILSRDPGVSFNIFFKQRELRSCPFSYHQYKNIQKRVRMFSLAGMTAMVVVALTTSLITNLIFGGKLPSFAASFGWTQNSWSAGADTVNDPTHSANKDGLAKWLKFFSGANVDSNNNELKLLTTTTATSTVNFSAGSGSNFYLNGTTITLKKQDAANCATTVECTGNSCNDDFDNIGSKYCHATSNKCIDFTSNTVAEYANNYIHCSDNTYAKTCANGTWGATTTSAGGGSVCTPGSGANTGLANGGWQTSSGICTEGSGFGTGACNSCNLGYAASSSVPGCYTTCPGNDNTKCVPGFHCYSTDSTCRNNAPGNLCDANSDCTSNFCSGGVCIVPCDVNTSCGSACSYNSDAYATVQIGTQCWFAENLRTTKNPNGVDISASAYCNPAGCGSPWGRLYSWTTAMNGSATAVAVGAKIQGICPSGWHIPSDYNASASDDWQKLSNYLGGNGLSGEKIKDVNGWLAYPAGCDDSSCGYKGLCEMLWDDGGCESSWHSAYSPSGTNSSGFTAPPAGNWYGGSFGGRGSSAYFWSSGEYDATNAWYRTLYFSDATQYRTSDGKTSGFSVRCLKD